jgi:hypothetical protein
MVCVWGCVGVGVGGGGNTGGMRGSSGWSMRPHSIHNSALKFMGIPLLGKLLAGLAGLLAGPRWPSWQSAPTYVRVLHELDAVRNQVEHVEVLVLVVLLHPASRQASRVIRTCGRSCGRASSRNQGNKLGSWAGIQVELVDAIVPASSCRQARQQSKHPPQGRAIEQAKEPPEGGT